MKKILTIASREYKSTALTKAFLFGAVIFPAIIWGIITAVTMSDVLNQPQKPLHGTLAVLDTTPNSIIVNGLREQFDSERQRQKAEAKREKIKDHIENNELAKHIGDKEDVEKAANITANKLVGEVDVTIVAIDPADRKSARDHVLDGTYLALVIADEHSIEFAPEEPPHQPREQAHADANAPPGTNEDALSPGVFAMLHTSALAPNYVEEIEHNVRVVVQDERYRRAGMDPAAVRYITKHRPFSIRRTLTEDGAEQESQNNLIRALPFVFLMLMYMSVMTGGQYLLMGTLEEKSSRVMEVILSACSPMQLLVGKLIGQGAVGLTMMGIYATVGLLAANRFDALPTVLPDKSILLWFILYFIMAYMFMGAMMTAIGSAVTEIREAQALYAPIIMSVVLIFLVAVAVTVNPASPIARGFSFFPPTTPFVMVMRLSQQAAHPIPLWEILAATAVGFIGVAVVMWGAAKVFRVGVLMYGTPPTLLGLIKWIRQA